MRRFQLREVFTIGFKRPPRLLVESSISLILCVAAQCLYVSASQPATASAGGFGTIASSSRCAPAPTGFIPQTIQLDAQPSNGLHTVIDRQYDYTVTGNSVSQIYTQMTNCTPISEGANRYAATTYYNLNWQLQYQQAGNICSVDTASVGLHIALVFPVWSPNAASEAAVTAGWNRFISDLHTHEAGHVARDIAAGTALQATLQALPSADCSMVTQLATQRADALITQLDASNQHYDRDTDHGRTQGAVLSEQ
ncbi:DUF922 domain-containing protein [Candidatus Saccharibacteria bacterium]|nr:DUF922 domain-containing protein [Candidatus Saccharibacteria bacterium]